MMMMNPDALVVDISVVIPTYNRPETLAGTIESYLQGSCVPREIVIVDQSEDPFDASNYSGLPTAVRVIPMDVPSLTRARNLGIRSAVSDVILCSDDDILLDEASMAELVDAMSDADVALIAGISLDSNGVHGNPMQRGGGVKDILSALLGLKKPWRDDGYVVKTTMRGRYPRSVSTVVPTEWAMGYFFCVRKSNMERWNCWFDERLKRYAYAEDLDFSMRYCRWAKEEGLNCLLNPRIYVNHLGSAEWRTPSEELVAASVRNRRYLSRKLFPHRPWLRLGMFWCDLMYALCQIGHPRSCMMHLKHLFG